MLKNLTILTLLFSLASCSATHKTISKRNLTLDTSMAHSIFLDPVSKENQIVFIKVRNTTASQTFNIEPVLIAKMQAIGFTVTSDIDKANFMLNANVRDYRKYIEDGDSETAGLGGAALGGLAGSAIGDGSGRAVGAAAGAAFGGLIGSATDAYIQDVTYTAVIDIQIAQRIQQGGSVSYKTQQNQTQGAGSSVSTSFLTDSDWKKYETVLTSSANKINLEEFEATPAIINSIVQSLSGVF